MTLLSWIFGIISTISFIIWIYEILQGFIKRYEVLELGGLSNAVQWDKRTKTKCIKSISGTVVTLRYFARCQIYLFVSLFTLLFAFLNAT